MPFQSDPEKSEFNKKLNEASKASSQSGMTQPGKAHEGASGLPEDIGTAKEVLGSEYDSMMSIKDEQKSGALTTKSLSYTNYLYLFNNPNDITIASKYGDKSIQVGVYFNDPAARSSLLAINAFGLAEEYVTAQEQLATFSYTIFSDEGELGDFPDLYPYGASVVDLEGTNGLRNDQVLLGGLYAKSNFDLLDDFYYNITNDIGKNPRLRHKLIVDPGDSNSALPTNVVRYEFNKKVSSNPWVASYETFSEIGGSSGGGVGIETNFSNQIEKAKLSTRPLLMPKYVNLKYGPISIGSTFPLPYNNYYKLEKRFDSETNTFAPFKYRQNLVFTARTQTAANGGTNTISEVREISKYYLDKYKDIIVSSIGQGLIMNSSTRIGVPYDFSTALNLDLDLKQDGIRNTRPTYENVYNYYDPQYEPIAVKLINDGMISHNSLLSIYDLIYLSTQPNVMSAFLSIPGLDFSPENYKFSNINQILDNTSLLYQKYDASQENSSYSTSNKAYPNKSLSDWVENITTQDLNTDNVFISRKSIFLETLKQYSSYTNKVIDSKKSFRTEWLSEVKSGIYFSETSMNLFNQASEYESAFPFCVKINIPCERKGPIAKLLSDAGLLDAVNSHAASLIPPNPGLELSQNFGSLKFGTYANFFGGLINGDGSTKFNMFADVKLKTFNMHFMNKPDISSYDTITNPEDPNYVPDFSFVDIFLNSFSHIAKDDPKNVFIYDSEEKKMTSQLQALIEKVKGQKFLNGLEKLIFNDGKGGLMRTPRDIHNGKFAHQETLMYEIAKYRVTDSGGETYVQSIFLPMVTQNELTYLDTQVVPYQNYLYKIFVHKVVVGTKYKLAPELPFTKYSGEGTLSGMFADDLSFQNKYDVEPYLQFIRVPYYNTRYINSNFGAVNYTRIEDLPPLPPQVQIVPYKNITNKLLFMFNNSVGRQKMKPVPIFEADKASFETTAVSQGVDFVNFNGVVRELTFGSDDFISDFEVFRTETKPMSYTDMGTDPTLLTGFASGRNKSFIDNIMPNKDYYYAFRSIDVHGKISNPTEVYKIQMVKPSDSAPYLKIEMLNLEEEKRKEKSKKFSTTKSFQKYLLIQPSAAQAAPTVKNLKVDEDGELVGDYKTQKVEIGNPSLHSVFGRNYKLRITSKQTGKKIDVNFVFKNPKDVINEL